MGLTVAILGKFPPISGQVSTLNLWLANGLAEKGAKVVVCTDAYYPRKQSIRASRDESDSDIWRELHPGVSVVYAAHLSDSVFLPFSELGYVSYLAQARKTILAHKPDVIFSHYLEPYALAGSQIADELGIPHVVTHAGSDIVRLCGSEDLRTLYRSVLRNVTYFVPKSRIAGDVFAEYCPTRTVSPYLPDPRYFNGNNKAGTRDWGNQDEPVFGFYGKFVHGKKLDDIIQAFRHYRQRYGKGRLLFVGGEIGGKFHLSEYLDESQDEAIEVRRFIPNWEVPRLLNSLTCLVYTKSSYKVAQHAAIILREAVACNTPVIATQESLLGCPDSLMEYAQFNFVEPDAGAEALSFAMAEMVEVGRSAAKAGHEEYFQRGYAQYVDSWYQCLLDAAGQKK
ncbi:glycosyltransferase [Thalassomonas sp. RHCl1]|uniref:glycosyltransferase n=1 Tax=Thalassomonas sp. RHCl1 TaxID=2995320 RepID=UPI00248C494F|nr:glycosyltransferase [Thalassomonas sp. RHCl1]